MGQPNPRGPAPLPLAARRAAWDRLWRILLAPPATDAGRVVEHGDGAADLLRSPDGDPEGVA